jgi:hypothetical protein
VILQWEKGAIVGRRWVEMDALRMSGHWRRSEIEKAQHVVAK